MCIVTEHARAKQRIIELESPNLEFKPTSTKEIGYVALRQLLRDKIPEAQLFLSDISHYRLCSYDDIALFLARDETDKMTFVDERLDCDDFAYRLMGQFSIPDWSDLCFGIVWSELHALNICIPEDMEVLFVEPPTDTLETQLQDWMVSTIRLVII